MPDLRARLMDAVDPISRLADDEKITDSPLARPGDHRVRALRRVPKVCDCRCGKSASERRSKLRITKIAVPPTWLRAATAAAVAGVVSCSAAPATTHQASSRVTPLPHDPHTTTALLKIASVFNNEYDRGIYGPVYDRWDARSKALISRSEYIRRHTECPTSPSGTQVESARPGPHGAWMVRYVVSGAEARLADYWFYVDGRWVFDLPLSNPSSVSLYKLSGQQYLAALGCTH